MLKTLYTTLPVLLTGLLIAAIAGAAVHKIDDRSRRRTLRTLVRHHANMLRALEQRFGSGANFPA